MSPPLLNSPDFGHSGEPRKPMPHLCFPMYHKFQEVLNKTKTSGLAPYEEYDYAIKLLASTTPSCNCIYSCSLVEQKPMEE